MQLLKPQLLITFILFTNLAWTQTPHAFKLLCDEKIETQEYDSAYIYINKSIAGYALANQVDSSTLMNSQKALVLLKQKKSEAALDLLDSNIDLAKKENLATDIILALLLRKAEIASQLFNIDDSESVLAEANPYIDTLDGLNILESEHLLQVAWIKMRRFKMAEALVDSKKAYLAIQSHLGDDDKKVSSFLQLTSYLYSQLGQLDSAEVYTQKYVNNALAIFPKDHFYRGLAYNQLGTLYMSMRQFDKAIAGHKRSERIGRIMDRKGDSRLLSVNCNNLALTYTLAGEQDLALNYAKESLEMKKKSYGENSLALSNTLTNLSDIYLAIGDYSQAYQHAKAANDIQLANEPEDKSSLAYIQNFLANAMSKVGQTTEAKQLLYQNIATFSDESFGATPWSLGAHLHLGNIYLEEENADSAFYYHNHVLRENQKNLANFNLENITQYKKLAEARAIDNPTAAVAFLDTAAAYLAQQNSPNRNFKDQLATFTPDIIGMDMTLLKLQLTWKQYEALGHPKNKLEEIKLLTDTYLKYLSNHLGVIRGDHSLNKIAALNANILNIALMACRQQPEWKEDMLRYSDLSRDVLLKLFSSHFQVNKLAGVPDKIIATNKKFIANIRIAKEELQYALQKDSTANMNPLSSAIEAYQEFKVKIKKEHPIYFSNQFNLETPTLETIQAALNQDENIVQYTFVNDELLIQLINKNNFHQKWIDAVNIKNQVAAFLKQVKKQQFHQSDAQQIYNQIVAPITPLLSSDQLVIIADDILHYLNFEMLIADSSSNRYLIEDFNIVYASSFSQYLSTNLSSAASQKKKNNQLVFAPGFLTVQKDNYKERTDTLSWDKEYLQMLQQPFTLSFSESLNAKRFHTYTKDKADEFNFKQNAPQASLLFLGTHGLLNDINPAQSYLQFAKHTDSTSTEDDRLYATEIYGLPLQARIALLTACNTGVGEFKRGAGMLSLAHAFNSAGCQNIVHSLWAVDEASSIAIGKGFLQHLEKRKAPGAALRQAKLSYLKSARTEARNPYYWAGIVLKGTVDKSHNFRWWIWLGIGIIALILFKVFKT